MTAFDKLKNSSRSLAELWLKQTEIVSYGVITKLLADGLVQVEQVVREGIARKILSVPIIQTSASLFEESSDPQIGDLVLLLFVDKYNRNMFDQPIPRHDATKSWSIQDTDAVGYNKFAGVGVLLAPARGFAETVIKHYLEGGVPNASMRTRAKWSKIFKRELSVVFDAIPESGGFVDRLISYTFGTHNPVSEDYRSKVTRMHGFSILPDKTLEAVDATVTEIYSPNAPVVKDYRAAQTIKIGKGTSPAGDPAGGAVDVAAAVDVTIGNDADVTVTSESGLTLHFDKATVHHSGDTFKIESHGKFTIAGEDAIEILSSAASLVKLGNSVGTLGAMIDTLANTLKNTAPVIGVVGTPALASIAPNPAFVLAITTFKTQWDQIFS